MIKKLSLFSCVTAACMFAGSLHAQTLTSSVKVIGVTSDKYKGDTNPAEQHEACADTYPGSHWCSTQEYLDGGMAMPSDTKLDTAWIRPTIISTVYTSADGLVYVDITGGASTVEHINCRQWSSKSDDDSGAILQGVKDGKKQVVSIMECSKKLPSLCCAPVAE